MTRKRSIFAGVLIAVCSVIAGSRDVAASDYVWARSGYGSLPMGQYASSMSNGYGGYYVPRNAYGNNQESRGRFTNPGNYIVPSQGPTYSMNRRRFR